MKKRFSKKWFWIIIIIVLLLILIGTSTKITGDVISEDFKNWFKDFLNWLFKL